jgi:SAM-dependent methyltransferase
MPYISRDICPVCSSTINEKLISLPFSSPLLVDFIEQSYKGRVDLNLVKEFMFELCSCNSCQLIWQKNILDSAGMSLLYNQWIDPASSLYKNQTHSRNYYKFLFQDLLFVADLLSVNKPSQFKILDFGMGWGSWGRAAKSFGFDAVGAELSSEKINYAKTFGLKTIEDLEIYSGEFDYINSEQVMEHIDDLHKVMDIISNKLKVGGFFRFSVPSYKKDKKHLSSSNWKPRHDSFHPLEHINSFSFKSIKVLAGLYQLEVLPWHFFIQLAMKNPKSVVYIFRRMYSHFFSNNVLLRKIIDKR